LNSATIPSPRTDRKAFVSGCHMLLRTASVLIAIVLWTGATFAQQRTAGGADLFAPSLKAGNAIDAERALPITPFYSTATLKTTAQPVTLVRGEPATDYVYRLGQPQPAFSITLEPRATKTHSHRASSWFHTAGLPRMVGPCWPGLMVRAASPN